MYECKSCGGKVIPQVDDKNIGKCESCGYMMNLPTEKNERIINRYNKANKYRMNKEFERAIGVYESILDDDSKESDAYFGIFLCTYGIEYVKDPKTKKDIITCHKINSKDVFSDINYKKAIESSTGKKKEYYTEEAKKIDIILRDIIDVSKKEEPYDVFISYKETEINSEKRTKDSIKAQDLYEELTRSGLRVFFSRISLESVVGKNYEPYIYGALNTASVMLVIGSKKEYFESEWMKNEWSRYLKIIEREPSKLLVPIYYDMSPKDLPVEFAKTQALDMKSITLTQDVIHIVKKVVENSKTKDKVTDKVYENKASKYVARGYDLLEEGEYSKALEIFTKALDEDNECYEAYLGNIFVKYKIESIKQFINISGEIANVYMDAFKNDKEKLHNVKKEDISNYIYNDLLGKDYERYCKYAPSEEQTKFNNAVEELIDKSYNLFIEMVDAKDRDDATRLEEIRKRNEEIAKQKAEEERLKAISEQNRLKEIASKRRKAILAWTFTIGYMVILILLAIFYPRVNTAVKNVFLYFDDFAPLADVTFIVLPLLLIIPIIYQLFKNEDTSPTILIPSIAMGIIYLSQLVAVWIDGYELGLIIVSAIYIALVVGMGFVILFLSNMLNKLVYSIKNKTFKIVISSILIIILIILSFIDKIKI